MRKIKYNKNKDMIIAYYSFSGKTEKFINKLSGFNIININKNTIIDNPYILVTPTYNIGEVPEEVNLFLQNNHKNMIAVMSAGNRNWGSNFAVSADKISNKYNVDLIGKFEMYGTQNDVDKLISYIRDYYESTNI
ncbi:class Ib ribonucleoside-diphosphate reductase assembly flavoprotein NrdI [Staphylococcus hyicus]|uniref:class Ib ribonucleoside-diphosphate reductase assembly flavoprotein NrdI n=1 Tax=Staphylococcus hyicus TaxID=1284 RepID=UPI002738E700|nr:class Ib ribonucleoside-diphosphate reductase assembly flavoprotein NrdI [Staphylococcus hyicus]MDP4448278.1 class Ib ribonucleoside-diphosphate reductase assembly flavoprotein NrdI [Staphylococcus hyicus]MDP4459806.1 class Ib ribonucleoside-diphosphate reductase assembly flavoprotein NrdI [Staphylococcus hyicus]